MGASHHFGGTITLGEFHVSAKCLENKWNSVGCTQPPWKWVSCSRFPHGGASAHKGEGYLALQDVLKVAANEKISAVSEETELFDEAMLIEHSSYETHVFDFHIVYSSSYQVPIMYFHVRSLDGQPLGFDDFERDLPLNSLEIQRKAKWTFITREEHPFLNRPWFMLHPCGTGEWMKLLLDGRGGNQESIVEQYLISWLSVTGQAVGLIVSPDLLGKTQLPNKDGCLSEVVDRKTSVHSDAAELVANCVLSK